MRGKVSINLSPGLIGRITPACAGKSRLLRLCHCPCRDHPRVCGEKLVAHHSTYRRIGSPPRVRGKATPANWRCRTGGITPACAGKSCIMRLKVFLVQDHPRVCGEKDWKHCDAYIWVGSPPRVRGKEQHPQVYHFLYRITPACAGKSILRTRTSMQDRDHPRVCGEKTKKSP